MELSSEVILDYFLQSSLTIFNSNSNQPRHFINSHQSLPLRVRARSNVSTSVFKTDDTATLRTSPTFALNETFLFQRWLFSLARRSVLAMRCYSDLANDPLRSEWVKMLNEKQLTQQRSKIRSTSLNNNNNNIKVNNNDEEDNNAENKNTAAPGTVTFLAPNNQLPGTPSGGLWCKRRTIWRAAHEKTRVELPQAIVSSLTSYEIAQLQHFGAASSQIQQISPLGISLNDANQTFNGMMQDCGVPNFQELFSEKTTKKSSPATATQDSVDFCKRVARRWREGSSTHASWSYDTSGVIWRDVVEAVRFVLGCGNSVSNNNKNYESPSRLNNMNNNRSNLPPHASPTPATSKILHEDSAQAQEQRRLQVQQMLSRPSNNTNTNQNSYQQQEHQNISIDHAASDEADHHQERKLSATSTHWIKAIAAVVISVCFGDINDTQVPGSASLPEITSDLVRDVLTCVLEIVSQPSNSLFHEKCLLTVAAYLEFQNKMFDNNNNNFDQDPEKLTQIEILKESILEPLRPSKKTGTVSAPWWWNHEPPFVHVAWLDVDSADLVKTFALAFPNVSLIPGYTQPFEVADRARLESQIHEIRRNQELKETSKNCHQGVQDLQVHNGHNNTTDLFGETLTKTGTEHLGEICNDDENDGDDEFLDQVTRNTQSVMMKNGADVDILHYPLPKFRFQHREQSNDSNINTTSGRRPESCQQQQTHHSDYVDQVTRRRIERLRRKQQDEKALTAAALMAVPAPSLVSPSLCRLTAAARGHRSDRVILKNLPILPLSQDDDAEETAALEISLQKKSQDWVQEQRPNFASRPGSASAIFLSSSENNHNIQDAAFSQNNTLHIRPWIGAQRPQSAAGANDKNASKNTSSTLPPKTRPVSSSSSPSFGVGKTVLDAKSKISNLFSQQARQEQIHNASSTPWCITNALPAVSVANTRNNNKLGSTASGVVDSSFLLTKNRKQVATPLGNGTRAREKIRARILAEVISQQREFMTNLGK